MTTETLLRSARLPGGDGLVDLLVQDGRVAAVAAAGELRAPIVRELDGRWVLPGLWDNHTHFSQWAMTARRLDVSSAGSAREAAELVAARLSEEPASADTLIGYGFRDGLWPDQPSTALLDVAAGGRPVVLVSGDLHCAWATSSAQARYDTAPTAGLLREDDCFRLVGMLGAVEDDVLDEWAADAADAAARRGVVGVVDLEMRWNPGDWSRRVARGARSIRVEAGVYAVDLDRAIAAGLRTGAALDDEGLVRMGPLKIITDGSLNTRTAYCVDAYDGVKGVHAHGMLTVDPAELDALLARAVAAGISPTVHAIGDEANRIALDALARVGGGRIEHAQLVSPEDLPRFARTGVTASVQPEHAVDDRDVADRYWRGRTDRAFPLRSLLDAGATLALGSDAPVAPLDPWIAIAAAVARARGADAPWHPEQRITAAEALAASGRPDTGPVAGAVADLAIVDLDPLAATAAELRSMPVAATLLAGRFTWDGLG